MSNISPQTLRYFFFYTATFGFPDFHSPSNLHPSHSQTLVTLLCFLLNLGFHTNLQFAHNLRIFLHW